MNYIKNFLLPRIRYLFKNKLDFKEKIIISFRLIRLLFIIIIFYKKKYLFKGFYGKKNFKIFLDTFKGGYGTRGYYLLRNLQEPLLKFGYQLIKKGDVVIDGGANQGVFSLSFRTAIEDTGLIICVEPFKYASDKIRANFRLNKFKNYLIYKNTLSNNNKKNKIFYSDKITDASIIHKKDKYIFTQSITIDKIVKKNSLKKLNFIKLDIEGAEYLALLGAKKSLKKFKPKLYLEINNINNFNKINNFLKKFSYSAYIFNSVGKLKKLKKYLYSEKNIIFK